MDSGPCQPLGLEEARIYDPAAGMSHMSKEVRILRKMVVALAKTGTPAEKALARAVLVLGGDLQGLNRRLLRLEKASGTTTVAIRPR
jgi:hypothetical protein